ncbi:uncharacterized protein LOC111865566 isoform X2 [Cryptotermes secundus]|nr:uncharacterized protein LOC111865566 isoform X2 [Cryptotermes secundus]
MALVCVYVRKANYFQQVFKRHDVTLHHVPTPNIGFSKALSGFLMMMTQNGKLLYISDNAAEYLGHSMEDLLIHGDSVYDIIDKQDHQAIQTELVRSATGPGDEERIFLCRMNVSRNARRQMRFGDQKVVLVQGHYLSFLPLCSRNEPVFLATCTPVAMPETRECVVQGATNVFTSIHSMDMKFMHIDKNGEFHLGYPRTELQGASWYHLLHWDCMREAQGKHRLIAQSEQDRSCILLLRLQRRSGDWLWVHCVLQVKDNMENSQQPVIVCTNQVLSEREASVMRANSWLYHYYMVQSKLQYGLAYEAHTASRMAAAAAAAYYHPHPPPPPPPPPHPQVMSPYPHHDPSHHSSYLHHHHHQMSPAPSGVVPTHHHSHSHHQGLNGSAAGQHHHHQLQHPADSDSPGYQMSSVAQPEGAPASYRYGRRAEPEPVDYSLHPAHGDDRYLLPVEEVRTSPTISTQKRKSISSHSATRNKIDLMKTPAVTSPRSSPSTEVIVDLDRGGGGGGGGTVLVTSSMVTALQHPLSKTRIIKAAVVDPAEFMEQWNPSPPWSDTTVQKVPDIIHQDLSPYMTTTPPTPTGTPGSLNGGGSSSSGGGLSHQPSHTAFTFDWTPEQYVPNLQSVLGTSRSSVGSASVSDEEQFRLMGAAVAAEAAAAWPSEHRMFPLQPPPPPRLGLGLQLPPGRLEQETTEQTPVKDARDSASSL